jgi:ABC-type sugar transport system substrate-binding protein
MREESWVAFLEQDRITRRQLLRGAAAGAAGLSAAMLLPGCSSTKGSTNPTGTSPLLLPKLKGVFQGIAADPATTAIGNGVLHAWETLGQETVSLSHDYDPQKALSQAETFGESGIDMAETSVPGEAIFMQYVNTLINQKVAYGDNFSNPPFVIPVDPEFKGFYKFTMELLNREQAYLSCKTLFGRVGGQGKFIWIRGFPGSNPEEARSVGVKRALSEFPNITLVAQAFANWDPVQAQQKAETLATANPDVAVMYGQDDNTATGIVNALTGLGKQGVLVGGADGNPVFLGLIAKREAAVTCAIHNTWLGAFMGTLMFDYMHGVKFNPLESMLQGDSLVIDTPEAAQAYLELAFPQPGKPYPYDEKKMSRHLHPDDWDTGVQVKVMEPLDVWGSPNGRGLPTPPGFKFPDTYQKALDAGDLDRLNAQLAKHSSDIFAPIRAMTHYKGSALNVFA